MAKDSIRNNLHVWRDSKSTDLQRDANKQISEKVIELKADGFSCLSCKHTKTALGPKLVCLKKSKEERIHLVNQGNICQEHKPK